MKHTIILSIFGMTLLASAGFNSIKNSPIKPEVIEPSKSTIIYAQVSKID